jgi:hypothetical protein
MEEPYEDEIVNCVRIQFDENKYKQDKINKNKRESREKETREKKMRLARQMADQLSSPYLDSLKTQSIQNKKDNGFPGTVNAGKVSHENLSFLAYARFNSNTNKLEVAVIQHDADLEHVDFISPYSALDNHLLEAMIEKMTNVHLIPVYQSFLNEMFILVNPNRLISY